MNNDDLTPEEIATFEEYPDVDRPKTRGDCWDEKKDEPIGCRPCPFVTCRYNNYLTVTKFGRVILTWPGIAPEDVKPDVSCALDVAEHYEKHRFEGTDYPGRDPGLYEPELGELINLSAPMVHVIVGQAQTHAKAIRSRMLKVVK